MIITLADGDREYQFELEGWDNAGDVVDELLWFLDPNIRPLHTREA